MADEGHRPKARKEWLTSWEMGFCRQKRMLLQQRWKTGWLPPTASAAADDDTRLGGKNGDGGEGGWEGVLVWTCDADAHVRSGGEGLKSLPLPHATGQSVTTTAGTRSHGRRCVALRCSPSKALERSLQNRELGLAKTRGWGPEGLGGGGATFGVPPVDTRPGRAASGPGHCAHYATLLPWIRTHA